MEFIELTCFVQDELLVDIIISELVEIGYEGFEENQEGLKAYVPTSEFNIDKLNMLSIFKENEIEFSYAAIDDKNWNELWESSYMPVTIDDFCILRASFHEPSYKTLYDIIIEPQMSFGTGHHETTSMMIRLLSELDIKGKKVLDMGSGTGVLAIIASKMGAVTIDAIDINDWAYKNSMENIQRNSIANVNVQMGDASLLENSSEEYDLVMANINRNVLLQDMEIYSKVLKFGSYLMLSGFYNTDHDAVYNQAKQFSFKEIRLLTHNDWVALLLQKIEY